MHVCTKAPQAFQRTINYFLLSVALPFLFIASQCWAEENKPGKDNAKKDNFMAVPGVTVIHTNTASYETLSEAPPIKHISETIPKAKAPSIEGKYYDAEVPDTCDLAERGRLVVNTLTQLACPSRDYEVYVPIGLGLDPPRATLSSSGGLCWPKLIELLPLMRIMSGSKQGLEVDKAWAEYILHSIGPDGLWYLGITGRPWDQTGFATGDQAIAGKSDQYAYIPTTGRLLGALGEYYKITGDENWNQAAKKMVDALDRIAIKDGDKASFKHSCYYPNGLPPDGDGQQNFGWNGVGLCQYYRISKYKPALDLAKALINGYRTHFQPNGEYEGFHHSILIWVHAMAEYAYTAHDKEIGAIAKGAYECSKSNKLKNSIPSLGFFPTAELAMEPCNVADMTAIAIKLTQAGIADYWDDVDKYVRNGLVESQFTKPEQISDFIQRIKDGRAVGNPSWTPGAGLKKKPVEYNEWAPSDLSERLVGFFSTGSSPNDIHVYDWDDICCTANCSRAFYYAWENILTYDKETVSVNLLLNRVSEWADIESYIPYKGQVDIKIKKPCKLRVRVNDWIDQSKVKCFINEKPQTFRWDGNYIVLGAVKSDQAVQIKFPISERTEKVTTAGHTFTVIFRGNDAVDITPRGPNVPLYQRAYYRQEEPRYLKKTLFVSAETLKW